ncbi:hypothetical protein XBP1_270082 [Xenorhabdus bovienii str. puntauvense]|uniref:Uncharacterized protein n=1 Tax=Xenorhabdus bovienii str. puntauvense TaxID=1398201 RepID=A0A077NGC3_XENBV|nr:hypothetical protein XBFFR1_1910016 [Xenorhabdus bovienii str. feltiae France]CDG94598.1 hypothetical protein XBFFL1_770082 [Xenorhabdus bovienii str. feltiae Florida]CDG97542.1 hypothetical protein XBP1_270082 [Xenorhabdus bovienii str. puntauvense]
MCATQSNFLVQLSWITIASVASQKAHSYYCMSREYKLTKMTVYYIR